MPVTLLRMKLYIPPVRPNLVSRPQLIAKLNHGLQLGHKLTLISAPAGFGKSTLTSAWIAGCGRPAAWLSLDEGDNDLKRFLTYLVAALQTPAPTIGEKVLALLQSPQAVPTGSILTALLNEISAIPDNFILVLDDYHLIDAQQVDDALTFLLEHLPPQMHLVIATREDPQLPLARLRVRGQLTELRAADLRFSSSEAAEFLNQVMGLDLSAQDITELETRTEGWIAGLQLAAISMQGRKDTANLIRSFTGSHRFVLDYLIEEVLEQQSESVQTFLLQTAVLDRLTGSLCDALTGQDNGQQTLEILDRANLFIVPLDSERRWYRYHHLFADLLRQRLHQRAASSAADGTKSAAELHSRASEWYEDNGSPADAIRHALAAEDFKRAADLAELAWPAWSEVVQLIEWLGWVELLPDELLRTRPVLSVAYAQALLNTGKLEAAHQTFFDGMTGMKRAGNNLGLIQGTFVLAEIKMTLGHLREALSSCEYALQLTMAHGKPEPVGTEEVYISLSVLHREQGDLKAAAQELRTGRKLGEQVKVPDWQYRWCIAQARLQETLGDLDGAFGLLNDAERLYVRSPIPNVHPIAALKTRVWVAQGRLAEALALGYVALRIIEAVIIIAAVISPLTLIALSQEYLSAGVEEAAYFQTIGSSFLAMRGYLVGQMTGIYFCLAALLLYYLLYQSKLVPRFISVWGFIAVALVLTWNLLEFVGIHVSAGMILALPMILNEIFLAIWLIVKGFNSPAIVSKPAKAAINEA